VGTGRPALNGFHHVEVWVPDLGRTAESWGWLLEELGWTLYQHWEAGRSWRLGEAYLVFEQSPALTAGTHDRCRPGLNHLALHVADQSTVDRLVEEAPVRGWTLLFADRHPYAGGPDTYAAYLADRDGYEVELVAGRVRAPGGSGR
jgi:catechol 2,3-dioxygenase-like lactoylglutathione lyase family enzyme